MSINDPVVIVYNEKHKWYYLKRGRETFYDEDRYIRRWDTPEEAAEWCRNNLNVEPVYPDEEPENKIKIETNKHQDTLF